ncbi:Lrp/AsnC family transcriptional regulator [Virgibacillus sp. W0430]|uniref:Lrp/AsnC family transcriptional regulator n=1 Tax=Virgibacillus sp. W0430 TaxID=3391580 RepID=UPI003F48C985
MIELLTSKDLDEVDRRLLEILQTEGDLSNVEIARKINLSPPATHARVKRLEKAGFIKDYTALLNRERLGYGLLCFIFVKKSAHQTKELEPFESAVRKFPEIIECHHITGEHDYLLKVVIKNTEDLKNFIRHKISSFPHISSIQTCLSYEEVKATTVLPIPK